MGGILESTKFVTDNALSVTINAARAGEYARRFDHGSTRHWLSAAPFDFSGFTNEEKLHFLFLFNALSFSYWGEPKWTVEYSGKEYDGAWGMIVALGHAVKTGCPILEAAYCSDISFESFSNVLKGNVDIPLLEQRWSMIRQLGSFAMQQPLGTLVKSANGEALVLLDLILEVLPSFRDESEYQAQTVCFQKRAQLLVSDIYHIFGSVGYGNLRGVDRLTACADYKLPQILRKLGILEYSKDLSGQIDAKNELAHGSLEEIEIRASTIQAIDLIKNEVRKQNPFITSMEINDHLWLMTQKKFSDDKPYHRTRTTAY